MISHIIDALLLVGEDKMHKLMAILVLFFSLIVPSVYADEDKEPGIPQDIEELKVRISKIMEEETIVGAQITFFDQDGITWSGEFGLQNKATPMPVQADTLFRAGSATKTFIALAIAQLVNQGEINLHDSVLNVVPEVEINNPWQQEFPVKIINLLEHTAGLDDMHFRNFYNVQNPNINLVDAINRDIGSLKVRWIPGTRHAYSNPGYGILGYIIEKISGQKFEDYVKENILNPLGMINSGLSLSDAVNSKLSNGFSDGKPVGYRHIYLRPAGSLHTTAKELALLGQYLLTRGHSGLLQDIDSKTIQAMESPTTTLAAKSGLTYGYGQGIYHATRGDREWFGHNGGIGGFTTSYGYSPELGLGYALMINSDSSRIGAILNLISGFLSQNKPFNRLPIIDGIDESIDGYYRLKNDRNALAEGISNIFAVVKASHNGSKLTLTPIIGGSTEYIYHVGKQFFKKEKSQHANTVFIKDSEYGPVLNYDGDYLLPVGLVSAWFPLIFLSITGLILALNLLYLPIWFINLIRKKISTKERVLIRLYPVLSIASLGLVIFASLNLTLIKVTQINWQTLSISIATVLFLLFGVLGLWQVKNVWYIETSKAAKYFSMLSSLSIILISGYLWHFNYLGLSLWSW